MNYAVVMAGGTGKRLWPLSRQKRPKQVLKLLDEIRERTGIAVLFITHDLRVAAQICNTIVVMQKGRIVEAGSAEMVLTAPQQDYTRALIDAAPGSDWDFQNFRPVRASAIPQSIQG